MTLRGALLATGQGIGRFTRWLVGWSGAWITSIEGRVDKNDVRTVAAKLVPRFLAIEAPAKAASTDPAVHNSLRSILGETLIQEDVFMAACALGGAILWSFIEIMGRKQAGPTAAAMVPSPANDSPVVAVGPVVPNPTPGVDALEGP